MTRPQFERDDLEKLSVEELRKHAERYNIQGFENMERSELVRRLEDRM